VIGPGISVNPDPGRNSQEPDAVADRDTDLRGRQHSYVLGDRPILPAKPIRQTPRPARTKVPTHSATNPPSLVPIPTIKIAEQIPGSSSRIPIRTRNSDRQP